MRALQDPVILHVIFLTLLAMACAAIVVIDVRKRIIPDALNLAVALLGLAYVLLRDAHGVGFALLSGLAAAGLVWLVREGYYRWRGIEGIGLGDVKLFGAAGIWTGLSSLPFVILVAAGSALAAIVAQRLMGNEISAKTSLPFGPFIALGLLAAVGMRLG